MSTILLDTLTTMAEWPWLHPIKTVAHAASAVIGLSVTIHRAIRYRRRSRYREPS